MIDYFFALSILFNNVCKSIFLNRCDVVFLSKSLNKTFCFDFLSFKKIPFFLNSAMDGYAFNYEKLKYKFDFIRTKFFIIDVIKAGDISSYKDFDGEYIIEIMTGAKIPSFFNVVVRVEDIQLNNDNPFEIFLQKSLILFDNIRLSGDDFSIGDFLFRKGEILSSSNIVSISTFGLEKVPILKNFNIFLICTGNEVIDSFDLNFESNFVHNSLSEYIKFFFKLLNINIIYCGMKLDSKNLLKKNIIKLLSNNESSIIITTGAVSKGKADILPLVLSELNIKIIFHGVAIKPGKPILFANYNNFHYFFCLPGNPISSIVGLRFFIYPFIKYLNGGFFEHPFKAILEADYFSFCKIDSFLKAFVYFSNSNFYVKILIDQQSFKVQSFVKSNSFVFLRAGDKPKKGDILKIYFYNPMFFG